MRRTAEASEQAAFQLCLTESASLAEARLHGLDALRALAIVLVLVLHAAVPYLLVPMPGLAWPVRDAARSPLVDGLFWWIEGFVMPLFFLMAGFFAAGIRQARGTAGFLRNRRRRILLPLVLGGLIILPMDLYVWVLGWVVEGKVKPSRLTSFRFDGNVDEHLWGLAHLWFLQYLFLYCLLYAALCGVWALFTGRGKRLPVGDASPADSATGSAGASPSLCSPSRWSASRWFNGLLDRLILSPWKPLVLAVPGAVVLWHAPQVVVGFQHGFFPFASKFLYTLVFFGAGIWMHRFRGDLKRCTRYGAAYLALSIVIFAGMLPLIRRHLDAELSGASRLLLVGSISLFAWLTVLGLVGLFVRRFERGRPGLRSVAEASFWTYLVHHPIVGLAQIDLARTALPAWVKCGLVVLAALAFSLLTYRAIVRNTWLGTLLNGKPSPIAVPAAEAPSGDLAEVIAAHVPPARRRAG